MVVEQIKEQKIQRIVVLAISAMIINFIVFVESIVYLVTEVVVEQLGADHGHEHRPHHDRHAHLVASCFVSSQTTKIFSRYNSPQL